MGVLNCFKSNKDTTDMINSMQVLYNKANPVKVDPNVQALTDLKSRIEPDVYDFIKSKIDSDKKVQTIFKIYL